MRNNEIKKDNKPILEWVRKNKKPLIIAGACVTVVVGFFVCKKIYSNSWYAQDMKEYDFLKKGPIETINEYREQIRIRHCNGEDGMFDKLMWIDKVIQSRPENVIPKGTSLNLPKREHGWYLPN